MGLNTLSQAPKSITLDLYLHAPGSVLETSCVFFPLSLLWCHQGSTENIKDCARVWYKQHMKRGTIAKTPFNYYIPASQPVNNPLSTLKTSYILDILICWGFFPPSLPPRIPPSLSSPSVMQVPRFYRRLQLDQIFRCGKEVPSFPAISLTNGQECSVLLSLP